MSGGGDARVPPITGVAAVLGLLCPLLPLIDMNG